MKKKLLCYILFCFFLGILIIRPTYAAVAIVSVSPSNITVDTYPSIFSVNVTITNATNVFGWQIVLLFNASVIQCTDASTTNDNIFGSGAITPAPQIDNVNGKILYGANAAPGAPTFNGSGLLCVITFNATAQGSTDLTFDTNSSHTFYSYIYDSDMNDLPSEFIPGTVTVISEFTSIMLLTVLVLAASAAIIFRKKLLTSNGSLI